MSIEVKVSARTAVVGSELIAVPAGVPELSAELVEAAVQRSPMAFALRQELQAHVDAGTVLSRREVKALLKRGCHRNGRPEGNSAVVVAYYARRHPRCFARDAASAVTDYLKAVDQAEWARIMADLAAFVARLNEQRREDERTARLKKEREADDLAKDDRKRTLIKENGTKADRKRELQKRDHDKTELKARFREASERDFEDELTASGKLRLSDSELTRLTLNNKGFTRR